MNDRHDKVVSLIQEHAATFIQHEANTDPLITVTNVDISPDYKNATVYFTTIPNDKENEAHIFLQRIAGEFRHYLKKKSNLKIVPNMSFSIDYGERHRQYIDDISRDITHENKD